jgi:hypothetical protein
MWVDSVSFSMGWIPGKVPSVGKSAAIGGDLVALSSFGGSLLHFDDALAVANRPL